MMLFLLCIAILATYEAVQGKDCTAYSTVTPAAKSVSNHDNQGYTTTVTTNRGEGVSSNTTQGASSLYFNLTEHGECQLSQRSLYTLPNILLSQNLTLCLKFIISGKEQEKDKLTGKLIKEKEEKMTLFSFTTANRESAITISNRKLSYVRDLEILEITELPPATLISTCFRIYNTYGNNSGSLMLNISDGNRFFTTDLRIPFNWFWLLETQHQPIDLHVIHYCGLRRFLLKDINYWDRQLEDSEIDGYFKQQGQNERFIGLLQEMSSSEEILSVIRRQEIQFIQDNPLCHAKAIPSYFRCNMTCEHINSRLQCDGVKDCIDGSDESSCTSSLLPHQYYIRSSHSVIRGDVLLGLNQFSVCFSISGVSRGTVMSYSEDLVIYFDAAESITVILFEDYPVYFAVRHHLSLNRICIRMDSGKHVDLFTNGERFRDQRTVSEIPAGLEFGEGDMLVGLEDGDMFGFTVWGEGLSDDEMLLYSSVPTCAELEGVLVEWKDVVMSINKSMMDEALIPSDVCELQGLMDYNPSWEEFESMLPPELPDRTVILLDNIQDIVSAEQSSFSTRSSYLLPSNTELCFNFNFTENHTRRNFTVTLAVDNPYGFSNINVNINSIPLTHPCLHCSSYTHTLPNVPITNNQLCIQDQSEPSSEPIYGYPVTDLTGTFIKSILVIEQPEEWLCEEQIIKENLYGRFMWGSSNTVSSALCPLGYLDNNYKAGFATKVCEVYTDDGGVKRGVWSNETDLVNCQHRFEYESIKQLLDNVERNKLHLLKGQDLLIAIRNAVNNNHSFTQDTIQWFTDTCLKVLEKERNTSTSNCWYSSILQTVFTSPYNDMFLPVKPTLLPTLTAGGLDVECTQRNIYHNSFDVNYFRPSLVLKCTFAKNGETNCEDISKEDSIPTSLNSSVMIIETPTRNLAPLSITKVYLTTVIASSQYFGTFLAEDQQVVNLVSPNIILTTDAVNDSAVEFTYYYRASEQELTNAYCAHEAGHLYWYNKNTTLTSRDKHHVSCVSNVSSHNLGVLTNSDHPQADILFTFEMIADIITIVFLIMTGVVCGCWVHPCQNTAQLYVGFSVFYGATYALKLSSYSAHASMGDCGSYGALVLFCLLTAGILLLAAGVGLHLFVEDKYHVQNFVGKSICVAFGAPLVLIFALLIYDAVASRDFSTVFVTADKLSDLRPIECWVTAPVSYVVILTPLLLTLLYLFIILVEARLIVRRDRDNSRHLTKALINSTMIIALLISVTWTIGAVGVEDLTLQYVFKSLNLIQGVVIFYLVCIYSTSICGSMWTKEQVVVESPEMEPVYQNVADNFYSSPVRSISSVRSALAPIAELVREDTQQQSSQAAIRGSSEGTRGSSGAEEDLEMQPRGSSVSSARSAVSAVSAISAVSSRLSSGESNVDSTFNWVDDALVDEDMKQLIENMEEIAATMDNILVEDNLNAIEELINEALKHSIITPEELSEEHVYSDADYDIPEDVKQHHDYEFLPLQAGKTGAREIVRMKSTVSDESDDSTYTVKCDIWHQDEKDRIEAEKKEEQRIKEEKKQQKLEMRRNRESKLSAARRRIISSVSKGIHKNLMELGYLKRKSRPNSIVTDSSQPNSAANSRPASISSRPTSTSSNNHPTPPPKSKTPSTPSKKPSKPKKPASQPKSASSAPPSKPASISKKSSGPTKITFSSPAKQPSTSSPKQPSTKIPFKAPAKIPFGGVRTPFTPPRSPLIQSKMACFEPAQSPRLSSLTQPRSKTSSLASEVFKDDSDGIYATGDLSRSDSDNSSLSSTQSIMRTVTRDNPDVCFIVPDNYESDQ